MSKNAEGWIRHRGGKCPVDKGVLVDVRFRNGDIIEGVPALESNGSAHPYSWSAGIEFWKKDDVSADIMAYRLHKPAEQVEACSKPELKINLPDGYGEICGAQSVEQGPFQWRDRITEIDVDIKFEEDRYNANMACMNQERADLVKKLASEGFALIGRVVEPVEDMSDWRNWKAGDLIQCTDDMGTYLTSGNCYVFERMEEGSVIIKEDDDGDESGASLHKMKFHSRPSA